MMPAMSLGTGLPFKVAFIGLSVAPIGIVLLTVAIIWLVKVNRRLREREFDWGTKAMEPRVQGLGRGHMKTARRLLTVVGVVTITMATIGLWFNGAAVYKYFSILVEQIDDPHFCPVFCAMSMISCLCNIALLICGIQFVRRRTNLLKLFVGVIVFEITYFLSLGPASLVPEIGVSVASASMVANGGMLFQGLTLFPLWAPFLAVWAARKISWSAPRDVVPES
jgi:hypothetical protein